LGVKRWRRRFQRVITALVTSISTYLAIAVPQLYFAVRRRSQAMLHCCVYIIRKYIDLTHLAGSWSQGLDFLHHSLDSLRTLKLHGY